MSLDKQREIIENEIATFNARKSLAAAAIIIIAAFILKFFLPDDPAQFGVLCTIPALLMILYIFIGQTRSIYSKKAQLCLSIILKRS